MWTHVATEKARQGVVWKLCNGEGAQLRSRGCGVRHELIVSFCSSFTKLHFISSVGGESCASQDE